MHGDATIDRVDPTQPGLARILAVAEGKRNKNQRTALRNYFVGLHPEAKKTKAEMDKLQLELDALAPPVSLVMSELDEPRMTAIFKRGDFLSPGEPVEAAAPAILPALDPELPWSSVAVIPVSSQYHWWSTKCSGYGRPLSTNRSPWIAIDRSAV